MSSTSFKTRQGVHSLRQQSTNFQKI